MPRRCLAGHKSQLCVCMLCPKIISEFIATIQCRSVKTLRNARLFQGDGNEKRNALRHHLVEIFGKITISLGNSYILLCIRMRYKIIVKCDVHRVFQIKLLCVRAKYFIHIISRGVKIKFDILYNFGHAKQHTSTDKNCARE